MSKENDDHLIRADKELTDDDSGSRFSLAMKAIKERNLSLNDPQSLFRWEPKGNRRSKCQVPKLLELSLNALVMHSDAITSLGNLPDELRHKLSRLVGERRKINSHFVELLAKGRPTEIRVSNVLQLTEEEFIRIFSACDTRNLTVLQLDLCGQGISDYSLYATLRSLPALTTLSLMGATRLTEIGLKALVSAKPALQSINISQCHLLTSDGMKHLIGHFESTLRELYMDECPFIDAMHVLPALLKIKHLEVLSMAGNQTISDDFVIGLVEVCGANMKELVFAECQKLTDKSIKIVSKTCPKLHAIDLSFLRKLTDSTLEYLANGCREIHTIKFLGNDFSDEAVAAFVEASGASLNVLSLNKIYKVAFNTTLSIAKFARNLLVLDLSWCQKVTDKELGEIVDSCSSLKLLKIFRCTQITERFLNGHSNSTVKIIGSKLQPVMKPVDVLEVEATPLRYF